MAMAGTMGGYLVLLCTYPVLAVLAVYFGRIVGLWSYKLKNVDKREKREWEERRAWSVRDQSRWCVSACAIPRFEEALALFLLVKTPSA